MKAKIIQALKTKYSNLGLSDTVLASIAETLAGSVTDEANIETAVAGVESMLNSFQAHADKRVTDAVAKAKKPEAAPNPEPIPQKQPEATPGGNNDLLEAMKTMIAPLVEKINAIETGKVTTTRKQALEEKLKNANPALKTSILSDFELMSFQSDEAFDAYLAKKEADLGELLQAETEQSLGAFGKPIKASGGTNVEPPKEEIDDIVNAII